LWGLRAPHLDFYPTDIGEKETMAMSIEEARIHADTELAIRAEIRELTDMLSNQEYRTKTEKEAISAALQEKRQELNAHLGL
jgi:hypothetical protein